MEDEKIIKLRRALESATPAKPKTTRKAASSQTIEGDQNIQAGGGKVVRQSIKGNGNVQIGGGVGNMTIRTSKGPKIEITAPVGSLGANPAFRARIEGLLKQINDYRYQRLGKAFKFGALYGDLAKAFDIDPKNWKAIWMLDESVAAEVIPWLEAKLDSTQQGRLEKAARREGYAHTRGHIGEIGAGRIVGRLVFYKRAVNAGSDAGDHRRAERRSEVGLRHLDVLAGHVRLDLRPDSRVRAAARRAQRFHPRADRLGDFKIMAE